MSKQREDRYVCKCACGGNVRGIDQFDRTFTWCEKCTPVVQVKLTCSGDLARAETERGKQSLTGNKQ